jgi:hypothetical protein
LSARSQYLSDLNDLDTKLVIILRGAGDISAQPPSLARARRQRALIL